MFLSAPAAIAGSAGATCRFRAAASASSAVLLSLPSSPVQPAAGLGSSSFSCAVPASLNALSSYYVDLLNAQGHLLYSTASQAFAALPALGAPAPEAAQPGVEVELVGYSALSPGVASSLSSPSSPLLPGLALRCAFNVSGGSLQYSAVAESLASAGAAACAVPQSLGASLSSSTSPAAAALSVEYYVASWGLSNDTASAGQRYGPVAVQLLPALAGPSSPVLPGADAAFRHPSPLPATALPLTCRFLAPGTSSPVLAETPATAASPSWQTFTLPLSLSAYAGGDVELVVLGGVGAQKRQLFLAVRVPVAYVALSQGTELVSSASPPSAFCF